MDSKPVAIVTGASSGIGSAIAKRLARTGAMVAVHYKANEAGASAVVRSIEADGGSAFAIGADVSKPNEVIALIDAIVGRCGKIDILVNNAGILEYGLFG
jgi:3-oxoacyl-[acyl-carrier protein] reductase